ncbi:NADPH:quinone oxidoreductase [Siccirubricoccus deserti]|uniref:NADPH:quinone reductase n=1 Tax=Siccirubricoccus deserti TaxID=2013562 RepID=A0A9X0R1H7_9PROT|nr:NADPH:quinone reductase [Siccirubricoccus deserti]MBC4016607.1 NADPH:quinone reductase [Siccirubricoccus deserti]GGC50409.1 NADPH:quinone oxidoreductase [Siccirubricoccus deserti]
MRAIWYTHTGPAAEVLQSGERPLPEPAAGEVRVRLAASGVNPADTYRRAGTSYANEWPLIIPNSDGAGVVEALGAGADPALLGQRVWLYNAQRGRPFGTAAEFTCVPVEYVHALPDHIGFEIGACLGIPAMTAHRCLFADGPVAGLRVLVSGGGGAVGNYAVQLARWGGAAWVGATASGGWKAEDSRAAGAEAVFDYRAPDCAQRIMAATGGVDRIIEVDVGGNVALWSAVVALNGSVIGYASRGGATPPVPVSGTLMRKNVNLRGVVLNSAPAAARRQAMTEITRWLREGERLHRIAATFPLAQTAAAHEAVEAGTKRGTVVVLPQE